MSVGGLGLRAKYAEEDTAGIITAHQLLAVLRKLPILLK